VGGVGIVNKKERFAGAVLVLTLAVGIVVDVLKKGNDTPGLTRQETRTAQEMWRDASAVGTGTDDGSGAEAARPDTSGWKEGRSVGTGVDGAEGGVSQPSTYRKLDINKASVEELMLLPGIGPKKAEGIVAWRNAKGRFGSVEGLLEVKGIGEGTLERLKPYVCVDT